MVQGDPKSLLELLDVGAAVRVADHLGELLYGVEVVVGSVV